MENVGTWEPGEDLGWSWKFLISDGSTGDTMFPAPGMDSKGEYRSVYEIYYAIVHTDQELYAFKCENMDKF